MDIIGTLRNVRDLSRKVDEALALKQAVEDLQETVSALMEQLKGLERLLAQFKGGKRD